MAIIRWNDPFAGLTSLHSDIDEMFNSFFNQALPSGGAMPVTDVYTEDSKQLVTEVHLPGFTKDNVSVNVHEGMLEIKGEKQEKEEQKDKKRNYMVRQSSSQFYRRVALPKNADEGKVSASFEDGVLKVTVPFKQLPKPKNIAISEGKKKK